MHGSMHMFLPFGHYLLVHQATTLSSYLPFSRTGSKHGNLGQGEAWGVPTMRGYSREGLEVKIGAWWKREWKLIRKSEEEEFCAYEPKEEDFHQIPNQIPMPPLLAAIIKEEAADKGAHMEGPLYLDLNPSRGYRHRAYQIPGAKVVGKRINDFETPR